MVAHKALVTGAARGIGAAVSRALQGLGMEVLTPTRGELDLLSRASIARFLEANRDSGIDVLVNNAGINVINAIEQVKLSDWDDMMQVNLTAPALLVQGLAPAMKARGWGRIVNVSSVFSTVTKEKRAAYSATKAGLNGLTRTLAVELGAHGILVNAVGPGYVDTELTRQNNSAEDIERIAQTIPVGRMAQTSEIAKFVAFLCSEDNTYLTGQTLIVDGGFSCR